MTSKGVADQGWYLDSRVTHHLTNAVQNLTVGKSYSDYEMLLVGDGKSLSITHIGYTYFYTSLGPILHLIDMLCVLHITKNLISVSKLLANNNVIIEFSSEFCFVRDKVKGTLLAQGFAKARAPIKLIHADLWGPALMASKHGYKYYISLVNDFTRYSWIFPLTLKSKA